MQHARRRGLMASACLVLLVGVLAGCGGGSSSSSGGSSGSSGSTTGHMGGTMVLAWNGIGSSIDPAVDYDQNWTLLNLIYDGLLTWKKVGGSDGNTLVPDLAQQIPQATDGGKTYVFHLRPGIAYSNGTPVKASDFLRAIEREFTVPGPVGSFYQGIVGGDACAKTPKSCDLSKGIVADDAAGTVTFHLTAPDPDFLQKLALPFGYAVPSNTPDKEVGPSNPLPATGPYMIDHYTPNQEILLVRNPKFHEWSKDAQPQGYPDKIEIRLSLTSEAEVTMVEQGQADWMYDQPPSDRLNEIATQYTNQVHLNPVPQVFHMALNTRVAPFDNVKVRQGLNYATDRAAVIKAWGGPQVATPTCQILPPDFPGYEAYCPYTTNPGDGTWHGPDMAKAQQLIAESGTKGEKVAVICTPDEASKAICLYFVSLLKQLGYDSSIKVLSAAVEYPYVQDSSNKAQISFSYWYPDYPSGADWFDVVVGCNGFHANSTASANLSEFCDPTIQKMTEKAIQTSVTDQAAANEQWKAVDKATTDQAPWVSLFLPKHIDFVSSRVGNYIFDPNVLVGGILIDQAWVK
jgi:peptide/nickel transport system substrate-binding protein